VARIFSFFCLRYISFGISPPFPFQNPENLL